MRRWAGSCLKVGMLSCLLIMLSVMNCYGMEQTSSGDLSEEYLGRLELQDIEDFLQENESETGLGFRDLMSTLLSGDQVIDYSQIGDWIRDQAFGTLRQQKAYLAQLILLLLAFVLLQGLSGIFADTFMSDISFLAMYFLFLYNVLRVFISMQNIVYGCMDRLSEFTLLVQPVFCMVMIFSNGVHTAGLTYEMLLLVIYLVQTILQKILFPMVFVFLVTEFANYAWREEHFSSMAKLLEHSVNMAQKILVGFIIGMNMIQGMIAPALDQLKRTATVKAISIIPGIGQSMDAAGEMLLGSGILIKNCVGVTSIIFLILLCGKPVLEVGIMTFIYRVFAALAEPVTDKRVSGVLHALAKAGMLYLRVVMTAVLMLFLTVAIVCVASGAAQ